MVRALHLAECPKFLKMIDPKLCTAIVFMIAPGQNDPAVKKYHNIKDQSPQIDNFIAFCRKENRYLHHINLYGKVNHEFRRQIVID